VLVDGRSLNGFLPSTSCVGVDYVRSKVLKENPEHLRPYLFYGVDLQWSEGDKNATADCPFCSREGKFAVKIDTGFWRCVVCDAGGEKGGGNVYQFIRDYWKDCYDNTENYTELRKEKGLLTEDGLRDWGVCLGTLNGSWLVPAYNAEGAITVLYKYTRIKDKQGQYKNKLLCCPGLDHNLFGVCNFSEEYQDIYITEGPWDGIALHECMGFDGSDRFSSACVLATPGANVFYSRWLKLFSGRTVNILFDSDRPKEINGKTMEPAGYLGMQRVADILLTAKEPPTEVNYINWGDGGFDPNLPEGTDIRDFLTKKL